MENILVSGCLLGFSCRYDGRSKPCVNVEVLKEKYNLIPVCPEVAGGLKIPHPPAEISCGKVIDKTGRDVTVNFQNGAKKVLETALKYNCRAAVLKANSPSCGKDKIYNGSFTGTLIQGTGICAKLLSDNGIFITDENNLNELENFYK